MDRLATGMLCNGSKPLKDAHFTATALTTQDALNNIAYSFFEKPCIVNGCTIIEGETALACAAGDIYLPLYGLIHVEHQIIAITKAANYHPKLTYSETYYAPATDNDGNVKAGIRKRRAILSYEYAEGSVYDGDTYVYPENNVSTLDSLYAKENTKIEASLVTIETTYLGESASLNCYRSGNMLCINGSVLFPNDTSGSSMTVDTTMLPLLDSNSDRHLDIMSNTVKKYDSGTSTWSFNFDPAVLTIHPTGLLADDKGLGYTRLIAVSSVILW